MNWTPCYGALEVSVLLLLLLLRSEVMVPIDSAWAVFYSISIDRIIVSVTVFEIDECNSNYLELGQFRVKL